jgi:hypothetical protein
MDPKKHLSLKSPPDVPVKAGGRNLPQELQLIFMSKYEDEEIVTPAVIYAVVEW